MEEVKKLEEVVNVKQPPNKLKTSSKNAQSVEVAEKEDKGV